MQDIPRCVAPVGDRCGEAATWDAATSALYWCDVNRFLIHRLDAQGAVRSWFFDEPVAALSLTDRPGTLLVGLGSRLILWRPADDHRQDYHLRLSDWPRARLNDGRAAPNGDFWIGSMGNNVSADGETLRVEPGLGVLHRVRPDGTTSVHKRGLGIANTLCWSPDRTVFYFGDTLRNVLWAHDYDAATGAMSGERPFFEGFARGLPDGSATDAAGCVWNCRFGGGCIVRVRPDGTVDRVVEMPVRNITTCAFGGADLRTLFITTAAMATTEADRLAGSLFALEVEVPGLDGFAARLALGLAHR